MSISTLRNQPWTAAVVAATLVIATWAWQADASVGSEPSSVVATTPARILDTRDGVDLGLSGPLVDGSSQTLQVTGMISTSTGDATVVPAGATAVLLNVTSTQSTSGGFISVRPGDATGDPETSNVNFAAGVNTANAVTVALPTTGAAAGTIDLFFGGASAADTSEVLIDVVGYVAPAAVSSGAVVELVSADQSTDAGVGLIADDATETIVTLVFEAPAAGKMLVTGSAIASDMEANAFLLCGISDDGSNPSTAAWESAGPNGSIGQIAMTELVEVAAGEVTLELACTSARASDGNDAIVTQGRLSAVFTPD